jgi:predicted membrane protein
LKLEEEVCFALAALAVLALLLAEPFCIKPNIFIFVTIKIFFMYIYYIIIKNKINKNKINKNKINKNKINIISIKNLFCIQTYVVVEHANYNDEGNKIRQPAPQTTPCECFMIQRICDCSTNRNQ